MVRKERQNQNLLIKEKQKQNTDGEPEGLPLVGIVSSEFHRKEGRTTTSTSFDFMIILQLENALNPPHDGMEPEQSFNHHVDRR